jgi:hypothetical protein
VNSERRRDASGASAERSIDRLLRQRLRPGQGAPPAGACLEPDTLAAWIEGSLGQEELAAAESHSAGCERCQAMLAAMVRTEPVVQRRRWWQSLTARWLVPAAAAATAAALWISVAPDRVQRGAVPSSEADSAAAGPASTQARTGGAPETASSTPTSPPLAAEARSMRGNRVQSVDALEKTLPPPRSKAAEKKTEDLAARRDRAEPGQPVGSLLSYRKEAPAAPASAPAPAPPAVELKSQEVTPGPPPSAQLAGQVKAPSAQDAQAFLRTTRAASIDIVSPDPASRWRAGGYGMVRRSADGGVTWVAQESGTTLDFTAGSSPARDVCWLVGRGGVVVLSIDGKTWTRRPFPEPVDLALVSATDTKTATVTTSDGRRFSTTDGGATWSRTPPQEFPAAPF